MSSDGNGRCETRVAIRASGLSKEYRIYNRPLDRFKQAFGWGRRKYYRDFAALHEVNLEVRRGDMVGILGRNGSGKSTLLQIIAGTLTPTSGEVEVHGRVAALLELGSGFHMEAPGRENVFMNGAILGLSREQVQAKYDEIAEFADIGEFIDQPVKTYSSGMAVRLAFAVAAHVDAQVLIVDEALAVGDAPFQAKCFRRIERLREAGVTILLATHDIQAVSSMCAHALLLDHGHVAAWGPGKEIAHEYYRRVQELDTRGEYDGHCERAHAQAHRLQAPQLDQGERMGDGTAEITGFNVYDHHDRPARALGVRKPCRFEVSVRFHAPLENPHVGVALRDVQGRIVLGPHTLFEQSPLGRVASGTHLLVTFSLEANVKPGKYLLLIGVANHQDFWHWKDCDVYFDLCEVEVYGDPSWGIASVPTTIGIERISE
jgi:ABC-type polysaccharide/polyol phosphate transport system ATPase subunit